MQAQVLAEVLEESGETLARAPRSAAGDAARLRGIPMIGGCGGAVPGSRPGTHAHLTRIDKKRRVSA